MGFCLVLGLKLPGPSLPHDETLRAQVKAKLISLGTLEVSDASGAAEMLHCTARSQQSVIDSKADDLSR